ncbi:MAG: glutamate ligase domain-containing protein, partial [Gammaproteobacteria bacterium]
LINNLQNIEPATKTYAVFAVLADKDVDGIIDAVKGVIDKWYISQLNSERALSSDELQQKLIYHCPDCKLQSYPSISQAFLQAKQDASASSRIIVFGSFLTVAEVLSLEV